MSTETPAIQRVASRVLDNEDLDLDDDDASINSEASVDSAEPVPMTSNDVMTKPELYHIYGDNNDDDEEASADIYRTLTSDLHRSTSHHIEESKLRYDEDQASKELFLGSLARFAVCFAAMAVGGNLLFYVAEKLHESNPVLPDVTQYRSLYIFSDFLSKYVGPQQGAILGNALSGLFLGLASYPLSKILSQVFPPGEPQTLERDSTSPEPAKNIIEATAQDEEYSDDELTAPVDSSMSSQATQFFQSIGDSNLIRSVVAAVGLAYCFKKYEWNSKLQVASFWALANVLFWSVLDSTVSGFLTAAITAVVTIALAAFSQGGDSVDLHDPDSLADMLWIGSFIFIGQIIFGKITKILFNSA